MAVVITGSFICQLSLYLSNPNTISTPNDDLTRFFQQYFANGSGLDQIDRCFYEANTLVGSATRDYDLTALTDSLGQSVNFARLKGAWFHADPNNNVANDLLVGNAAANRFDGPLSANAQHRLKADDFYSWISAGTVAYATSGTVKNLRLTNSAGTNTIAYEMILIGSSA